MNKNCFLAFRNKKLNNFKAIEEVVSEFSSAGIYFDRVTDCNYSDGEEIARSVRECVGNYSVVVLFSPLSLVVTLKTFIEKLTGVCFDEAGVLHTENVIVFILQSDGGKLSVDDIVSVVVKSGGVRYERSLVKTVGAPREVIDSAIKKASEANADCSFNVNDVFTDSTIEIIYPQDIPKADYDSVCRALVGGLNDYIYALEDVTLAQRLYDLLKLRRMKISVAESFTGGGLAKRLVEVSGISEVYVEGLNTYSNESKMKRLGVKELTLGTHGAVSENTAYEMAEGLLSTGCCDLAVSTTGLAGPKSDSTLKPVGLCYIGVGTREKISVFEYRLQGSRQRITETAINLALFQAYKTIK